MGNAHAGTPSILPLQTLLHFRRVWSLTTAPPFPSPLTQSLHCKHNGAATANSELLVVLQKG